MATHRSASFPWTNGRILSGLFFFISLTIQAQKKTDTPGNENTGSFPVGTYRFDQTNDGLWRTCYYPKADSTEGIYEVYTLDGELMVSGVYHLTKDEITMKDTTGLAICPETARYRWSSCNQQLCLIRINDTFESRSLGLHNTSLTKTAEQKTA